MHVLCYLEGICIVDIGIMLLLQYCIYWTEFPTKYWSSRLHYRLCLTIFRYCPWCLFHHTYLDLLLLFTSIKINRLSLTLALFIAFFFHTKKVISVLQFYHQTYLYHYFYSLGGHGMKNKRDGIVRDFMEIKKPSNIRKKTMRW